MKKSMIYYYFSSVERCHFQYCFKLKFLYDKVFFISLAGTCINLAQRKRGRERMDGRRSHVKGCC